MPAEDPDDSIDPDDSGPRLSVTLKRSPADEINALPAAQAEQTSGRHPDTGEQSGAPQTDGQFLLGALAGADVRFVLINDNQLIQL
jgi:hypothetical protein